MVFSGIGVIWVILMLISLLAKLEYSILLTIVSIIFQSVSFCYSNIFTLSIFEVCALVLLFRYMFSYGFRIKVSRQSRLLFLFCTSTTITSIFSIYIFQGMEIPVHTDETIIYSLYDYCNLDFNSSFFLALSRLWLYSSIFLIIQSYFTHCNTKYDTAYNALKISLFIVSIVGIIQYLGIFNNNLYNIVELFHSINLEKGSAFYSNYTKLYSTFREPSYCGLWLSAVFFALLNDSKKTILTVLAIGVAFLEIVLSFSTTAFVVLVFMGIFSVSKKGNLKFIGWLLLIIIFAILFFCFTVEGQRWIFELSNKMTSISGVVRLTYIKLSYKYFFETFGLGVGFHKVQCMSLIGGLLGQTGVLSTIIFVVFLYSLFADCDHLKNRNMISAFLLATTVGTEVSSSGLLYSAPLWYALYLWAADYRSFKDKGLTMKGLVK